jgi:hypothetical protein
MICNYKNICRRAIIEWCKVNRKYLNKQFCDPLTDTEFNNTLNPENWKNLSDKYDISKFNEYQMSDYDDCYKAWSFGCEPFDDQLRAYVKIYNGKVIQVQGLLVE